MGITDELREYTQSRRKTQSFMDDFDAVDIDRLLGDIEDIADRIDAEHEHGMEERADRYSELRAKMSNCYIELPVDADGVPIRVGDVMEFSEVGRVQHLELWDDGGWVVVVEYEPGHFTRWHPSSCHHHKPTVEDLLREFGDWYAHTKGGCDEDGILAEYAAKLRLADDGKEQ